MFRPPHDRCDAAVFILCFPLFPLFCLAAITLFEVFKDILEDNSNPLLPFPSVWSSIPTIITETLRQVADCSVYCSVPHDTCIALGAGRRKIAGGQTRVCARLHGQSCPLPDVCALVCASP